MTKSTRWRPRDRTGGCHEHRPLRPATVRSSCPRFFRTRRGRSVRCLDAADLVACEIPGLVVNSLHLSSHPGTSLVERLGGIHRFMGWDRPVASDSGGFQVLSLARESDELVSVANKGHLLSEVEEGRQATADTREVHRPSVRARVRPHVLPRLLHPPRRPGGDSSGRASRTRSRGPGVVARSLIAGSRAWHPAGARPLLFAVVQGGLSRDLRQECAGKLQEIGFDGYGFGGWPIDGEGGLVEMVQLVAQLLPADAPIHALGIGKPEHVVSAQGMGYSLFDCVLPTRDARHGRLYVFQPGWETRLAHDPRFYEFVYIKDIKHKSDGEPIDPTCDCLACRRYSRSYVNHLFHIEESLHNAWQRSITCVSTLD